MNLYKIRYGFNKNIDIRPDNYDQLPDYVKKNIDILGYYWYGIDVDQKDVFIVNIEHNIITMCENSIAGAILAKNDIIQYIRNKKLNELI